MKPSIACAEEAPFRLRRILQSLLALLLLTGAGRALAEEVPPWRNDFVARLEVLALLQSLNAELLSHDSATLTLDRWCADHRLASLARITAERVKGEDKQPTAQQRQELGVSEAEPVRYRRVRLSCGTHVLSEADNWYVPSRLTPEMNRQLETTDIAFGRAVQALKFRRRTLSAELLWSPLPAGWEMGAALPDLGAGSLPIPAQLLQHRAVLTLPDGTPFSEVVETYTGEVLAFPEPPRPPSP
jgi:chorismate-pyruvate lyase